MRAVVILLIAVAALSVRADVAPEKPLPKLDKKLLIPNIDLRKPCKAYPQLKPSEAIVPVFRNREIFAYPANCCRCHLAKQDAPRKAEKGNKQRRPPSDK